MKRIAFLKYALLAGSLIFASCGNDEAPHKRDTVVFEAPMSGGFEVPPANTAGTGRFEGTYNKVTKELEYTITYSGLTGPLVAAHFHLGSPGVNGPVIIPLTISPSPMTGRVSLADVPRLGYRAQDVENALFSQAIYVNLHTQRFPGGEIRGDINRKPF